MKLERASLLTNSKWFQWPQNYRCWAKTVAVGYNLQHAIINCKSIYQLRGCLQFLHLQGLFRNAQVLIFHHFPLHAVAPCCYAPSRSCAMVWWHWPTNSLKWMLKAMNIKTSWCLLWKKDEWDTTFKKDSWWQSDKCLCFVGEDLKRCLFYPFLVISIVHHLGTLCDSATFAGGYLVLGVAHTCDSGLPSGWHGHGGSHHPDDLHILMCRFPLYRHGHLGCKGLWAVSGSWGWGLSKKEEKRLTGFRNSSAKSEVRLFSFWTNIVHHSSI